MGKSEVKPLSRLCGLLFLFCLYPCAFLLLFVCLFGFEWVCLCADTFWRWFTCIHAGFGSDDSFLSRFWGRRGGSEGLHSFAGGDAVLLSTYTPWRAGFAAAAAAAAAAATLRNQQGREAATSQQHPQHQPYRACSKNAFSKLPPSRQSFRARLADYSTTAAIFPGRKPSSASSSSLYWELERLISFA